MINTGKLAGVGVASGTIILAILPNLTPHIIANFIPSACRSDLRSVSNSEMIESNPILNLPVEDDVSKSCSVALKSTFLDFSVSNIL